MSIIGKMTQRRSTIPMKMVTKVKDSKKDYDRKKEKAAVRKQLREE